MTLVDDRFVAPDGAVSGRAGSRDVTSAASGELNVFADVVSVYGVGAELRKAPVCVLCVCVCVCVRAFVAVSYDS